MRRNSVSCKRRMTKCRQKIKQLDIARLSLHISLNHIYAQIFTPDGSRVLAVASTLDKEVKQRLTKPNPNIATAAIVGEFIAKRALSAGIKKVAFDRSGRKYHGRVKALADAARESGLIF